MTISLYHPEKWLLSVMVSLSFILLSSCGGNQAFKPYKRSAGAYYKVGNPYQIGGAWYTPKEQPDYDEVGVASWYGPNFHGKLTANGDKFDQNSITAAHKTLPLPSVVRVTNLENGRSVIVTVNDRGPFSKGRILDASRRTAEILGFKENGMAKVRVQFLPGQTAKLLAGMPRAPQIPVKMVEENQVAAVEQPKAEKEMPEPGVAEKVVAKEDEQDEKTGMVVADSNVSSLPKEEVMAVTEQATLDAPEQQATSTARQYFIQAGSYGMEANAENVKNSLASLGDVDVQATSVNNRSLHRVRLGPVREEMKQYILKKVIGLGHPDAIIIYE